MINTVIFDYDGLILDIETSGYQTWEEIYQEHGCELLLSTWAVCIGTTSTGFDPCDNLQAQLGHMIDRGRILTQYRERNDRPIELQRVLPGVKAYLKAANRLNFKNRPRLKLAPRLGCTAPFSTRPVVQFSCHQNSG